MELSHIIIITLVANLIGFIIRSKMEDFKEEQKEGDE